MEKAITMKRNFLALATLAAAIAFSAVSAAESLDVKDQADTKTQNTAENKHVPHVPDVSICTDPLEIGINFNGGYSPEFQKKLNEAGDYLVALHVKTLYEEHLAALCYKRSSSAGNLDALAKLGSLYLHGRSIMRDEEEGRRILNYAAVQGDINAMRTLAVYYSQDTEVGERDYIESLRWARLAAAGGDTSSMLLAGSIYFYGMGITYSYEEAARWYEMAKNHGDVRGDYNLGFMNYAGAWGKNDKSTALKSFQKADNGGFPPAATALGVMYRNGIGVEKDHNTAEKYFRKAAAKGETSAMVFLGRMIEKDGSSQQMFKDPKQEIFTLYSDAANEGSSEGMAELGRLYYEGKVIDKNLKKSFYWFSRAAKKGSAYAENSLGYFFENAIYVERSCSDAFNHYEKAAVPDFPEGEKNLARMYSSGCGIPADDAEADIWKLKADIDKEVLSKKPDPIPVISY